MMWFVIHGLLREPWVNSCSEAANLNEQSYFLGGRAVQHVYLRTPCLTSYLLEGSTPVPRFSSMHLPVLLEMIPTQAALVYLGT